MTQNSTSQRPASSASRPDTVATQRCSPATPAEIVRMEANFLQFPFFALDTRELKSHSGLTCTATRFIGDEKHEVTVRISRNSDCAFPGPLSRRIHFALLSKMQQEQGFPPFRNPITWSWYDLAKRLGLKACSGRSIQQMKEAIEATHGALIRTRYCLQQSERNENPLRKQDSAWHLYERYVFMDDVLPDGTIADTNHLWLSDWYLANLNSQYCGPINYELWQYLNYESRIASRLYEYLTWNFSKRIPVFRVGYERLAQFLPVKPLPHLSQIRQQLEPALASLRRQRLIESFRWETGSAGQVMLAIEPASRLVGPDTSPVISQSKEKSQSQGKTVAAIETSPASPQQPAVPHESHDSSRRLIAEFYLRWSRTPDCRPGTKELALADEVIAQYGADEATDRLLPVVVKLLKQSFPDAQNFGATRGYWSRAEQELRKSVEQEKSKAIARREEQQAEAERRLEREQKAALRRRWAELSEPEQHRIDRLAYDSADKFVRQQMDAGRLNDPLVELARLQALKQDESRQA